MDTSATNRAFKRRRVVVLFAIFVAGHPVQKMILKSVRMGKRFHLTNTTGPLLGGKVAYAMMLEAVGVAQGYADTFHLTKAESRAAN